MSRLLSASVPLLVACLACAPALAADEAPTKALANAVARIDVDPSAAIDTLQELAAESWPLAPYARYFTAVAEARRSPERGGAAFAKLLDQYPDAVFAPSAAATLAELLEDRAPDTLVQLARRYAGQDTRTGGSVEAARIALAAGRALAATQPATAADLLLTARRAVPGAEPGKEAARLLGEIRASHPELRPNSASALYDEALLAGREGDLATQSRWLDQLLEQFPHASRYEDAVLLRGRVMAGREGRVAAGKWLEKQARAAGSVAMRARFLYAAAIQDWNADRSAEALETFAELLSLHTGVAEEQRAHYAMGRIHESARRFTAAAGAYRECARGEDEELATKCQWSSGWAAYRAGNFDGAAHVFGNMAERAAKAGKNRGLASGREEALYWQGRSLERDGHRDKAFGIYRTLLDEYPDGYYAYVVERRTDLEARPVTVDGLHVDDNPLPEAIAAALERAQLLRAAGIDEFAAAEVVRAVGDADTRTRRAMLPYLVSAGAYSSALRTAFDLYRRNVLEETELYPFIYPPAFGRIVDREAQKNGLDPFLVYSLIRQESLFDERAVSPASAYGLMQLLLPTANRMAAKADVDEVGLEDLFRPEINIELGTAYLAELAARFDRNPVLMLAGYNAGARTAARWRDRLAGVDFDEFVERISYSETRNYVKKVLRNYRNYRRLYQRAMEEGGEAAVSAAEPSSAERVEQAAR
jgi:soluble lytic murein transglycosylase-like protein